MQCQALSGTCRAPLGMKAVRARTRLILFTARPHHPVAR